MFRLIVTGDAATDNSLETQSAGCWFASATICGWTSSMPFFNCLLLNAIRDMALWLATVEQSRDGAQLQQALDPHVLFVVRLNPEVRVKVACGPAAAILQQGGFRPVVIKVINESTSTQRLRISSPQSGPVYAGVAKL